MKIKQTNSLTNGFVKLKENNWLIRQRQAGIVVSKALHFLEGLIKEKSSLSLIEMSYAADELIQKNGCISTFKGYKGFPNAVCISVNKQLVHGIPINYKLRDGDIVSFDLGATFEGVIADAARTFIFGEAKFTEHVRLLSATKEALRAGINAVKIGSQIGCIGNAIFKTAKNEGFSVVEAYGGHSICEKNGTGIPHAFPFIANKSLPNNGIRVQKGTTLAIEPLLVIGRSNKTRIMNDGWTVVCDNICAHFEDTIFIGDNGVEILTEMKNE